jgi:hypothetical protein
MKELAKAQGGDSDVMTKSIIIGLASGLISTAAYYLF